MHGSVAAVIDGINVGAVHRNKQLHAFEKVRFRLLFTALKTRSHACAGDDQRSILVVPPLC